ncbi:unnamed protein product [Auanema sp. JU1783]|nr:unnamed protein product [Auanema sp. JU1783]
MPRNILSDAYRQYIKNSLITQAKEGPHNMEWLQFYKDLCDKQAEGTRPSLFLQRSLTYIDADEIQIPNFVTGKVKPPLAFPRKDNPPRRKIKNIVSDLRTRVGKAVSANATAKFDMRLKRRLEVVVPYSQDGEIPERFRKRHRPVVVEDDDDDDDERPIVAKRIRCDLLHHAANSAGNELMMEDEIRDKVPPLGQNPVPFIHPYDILRNLGEVRIPFPSYKYMGGYSRETHFDKASQFFVPNFFNMRKSNEMLLSMFPLSCPSVVNYTIAGVKRKGPPGTYVNPKTFEEVVGKKANKRSYETSSLIRRFFTFKRKVDADRCILCNRKFNKLYYLLIHYNTCYPRLDFLVRVPKHEKELKEGFQIVISENEHYNTEHYENLPLLPGEAANRFDPHFFMNPWDGRMMRDHVYLDLTTFIAGYIDTEQFFVATKHPLRFCDYYYHRKLIEYEVMDHQTAVLQMLWVEFIYLLSIETCRHLKPYVLYRLFIHMYHEQLHDLRLLPAMGNHIQYYTKKKLISFKLGRDIVERLNGRKKVEPTEEFDVLFKKMLQYIDDSRERHIKCLQAYNYKKFLANPIEPNMLEIEQLTETVLSFPFDLLEDTKYKISPKVYSLARKLNQRMTYGMFYEMLQQRRH